MALVSKTRVNGILGKGVRPSRWNLVMKKMWRLKLAIFGGMIILGLVFAALFAPYIAPHDPYEMELTKRLLPPVFLEGGDPSHLLGTDHIGRDLLSRIIYGSRISLVVGLFAVALSVVFGVLLGLCAGYYGRWIDSVISFLVNVTMSFPFILLAMSLVAVLGASLQNIVIALGATRWPVFTRVTRAETLKLRESEFILAAISLGFSPVRILLRHTLPNLMPSIIIIATVEIARAIIRESLLSFLGIGIQPPTPSWGTMLAEGRNYMLVMWWLASFPGFAIFLSALGINLLGDGLRDLIDPHLRKA